MSVRVNPRTAYRHPSTGRFISRRAAIEVGGSQERYLTQRELAGARGGQISHVIRKETARERIVELAPGYMDRVRVKDRGMIGAALSAMGVFTARFKEGARRIEIGLRGIDRHGHRHRIKTSIDMPGLKDRIVRKLNDYLVGSILDRMRRTGLRTAYRLDVVDWRKTRAIWQRRPGKRSINVASKSHVAERTPLEDVTISIRVLR